MVNQASNMGSSANMGSNWGWWIVAIIVAIVITWWVAYASYHNTGYYGSSYNQAQPTTTSPSGTTAAPNTNTGTNGNTNTQ